MEQEIIKVKIFQIKKGKNALIKLEKELSEFLSNSSNRILINNGIRVSQDLLFIFYAFSEDVDNFRK